MRAKHWRGKGEPLVLELLAKAIGQCGSVSPSYVSYSGVAMPWILVSAYCIPIRILHADLELMLKKTHVLKIS